MINCVKVFIFIPFFVLMIKKNLDTNKITKTHKGIIPYIVY